MDTNEKRIARKVVSALLAAGYVLLVNDSEEFTTAHTLSKESDVMGELGHTEAEALHAYKNGRRIGWVQFIWGEGDDCIQDYTISLEAVVEPILDALV